MQIGLYLHIPFCRQKCFYCDFASGPGTVLLQQAYAKALCREIEQAGQRYAGDTIHTVYIGGGTPTALAADLLQEILEKLRDSFEFSEVVEFTVEANPGTVTREKLMMLKTLGVNRLSFGVQSFDDGLLKKIGRIHTSDDALAAIAEARAAGFSNISMDLMYGLPGQTMEMLQESVKTAVSQKVEHISIYGLQIEEQTEFFRRQERGELDLPSDELVDAMYEYMTKALPAAGYERYEISNFARAGFMSRHNMSYWQDKAYIGLGASAHSYYENERFFNVAETSAYIDRLMAGESPAEIEEESTKNILMEEFCFLALRTAQGIDTKAFLLKFGCSIDSVYGSTICSLQKKGLIVYKQQYLRLTELGMKYGNVVFSEFILEK
jgi:oxygen-independent coproporphyrinogen III oxidase